MYYRARSLHLPLQHPSLRHRLGASKSSRQVPPRSVALSSRRISTVRQRASSPAVGGRFLRWLPGTKTSAPFSRCKALAHNYNLPPRGLGHTYRTTIPCIANGKPPGLGSDCPLRTARNSHREDNASGRAIFLAGESLENRILEYQIMLIVHTA